MKNDDREKDWNQELENLKIHVQAVTLPLLIRLSNFVLFYLIFCVSVCTHTHTCVHTQACCVEQQGSSVQSVLSSSPWVLGIRCRLSGLFSKHLYPLSYLARAKVISHASFPPCGPEFRHVKNKPCISEAEIEKVHQHL